MFTIAEDKPVGRQEHYTSEEGKGFLPDGVKILEFIPPEDLLVMDYPSELVYTVNWFSFRNVVESSKIPNVKRMLSALINHKVVYLDFDSKSAYIKDTRSSLSLFADELARLRDHDFDSLEGEVIFNDAF